MPPANVGELIAKAVVRLTALPNPELDAELLFRGVTGLSRAELLTRDREPVPEPAATAFDAAVSRRANHEPVQYILGKAAFWRDEFVVTPAVLIPRPDTEILVEGVVTRLASLEAPLILDLGTGSGCIALSLLRELKQAKALAVDTSEAALAVARMNARALGLESRIEFTQSRWLDSVPGGLVFDAIVSNPPYVAREDETMLAPEVRDFEPAMALFAEPADDLSSYFAILAGIGGRLRPSGLLAFEVGLGQSERVAALLEGAGLGSVEILPDLANIPRVVLGRRTA